MITKAITQKLDILWQDRAWQPRIRRVPVGQVKITTPKAPVPRMSPVERPVATRRPCRRPHLGMSLIQRVFFPGASPRRK